MKPIRLSMQAFGSYGNAVTIDFEKPEQNLFLITGDTGAGKTTIFDALVFALYGEASSTSNRKAGVELQSHFVSPELEPYVELSFTEMNGGEAGEYTVRRVPQHRRPLKRKGKADFRVINESVALTMSDGQSYLGSLRETNAKIQDIVGLTKDQFMQVAMIAQGEFMEMLRADSQTKKEIFRKLFGTELYREITEELKRRCADVRDTAEELGHYMIAETGHVVVPEKYPEEEELSALRREILRQGEVPYAAMEEFVQGLGKLCDWLRAEKKDADTAYKKARRDRDAARDAYRAAESLAGSYRQLDQAQETLRECEVLEEQNRGKIRLRTEILHAQQVNAEYRRLSDAEKAVETTEKTLGEQQQALPGLTEAWEKAAADEKNAREALAFETEAYSKVDEKVRRAIQTFRKLTAMEEEAAAAREKEEKARKQSEQARAALQELEQQETDWRTRLDSFRDLERRRAEWNFRKGEAEGIRRDLEAAVEEWKALKKQADLKKRSEENYVTASQAYSEANTAYEDMRRAYLDAQAGLLARQLEPGMPCPVCGSTSHPHPCVLTDTDREISREAMEETGRKAAALREKQEKAAAESHAAGELYQEKSRHYTETGRRLRERIAANVEGVPAQPGLREAGEIYNSWVATLQREDRTLKEQEKESLQLKQSLEGVAARREKLRAADEEAARQASAAAEELAARTSAVIQLRETLEYSSEQQARQDWKQAGQLRDKKEEEAQKAAETLRTAAARQEQAQALIRQFTGELPGKKEDRHRLRTAYELLLTDFEFSEEAWKDIAARYRSEDAERLQQETEAFGRRKASAESVRKAAQETIAGRERPALEKLTEAQEAAETALKEAEKRRNTLESCLTADRTALDRIAPRQTAWKENREALQRLNRLYIRLAGRSKGQRMDVETFVQRYYLERILDDANRRFRDMSAGQFELRMCDIDRAGEGKNRGLDLMVYSTVTGREREVRTLSGGESFMAALSLALGMADQIRENTANVNLDILFIDEGFGSLDNHSRDQAVRVLQQMAGGSRLIGIISHVTEMKQEIEDQLVVTKDDLGSHVKWVLS